MLPRKDLDYLLGKCVNPFARAGEDPMLAAARFLELVRPVGGRAPSQASGSAASKASPSLSSAQA